MLRVTELKLPLDHSEAELRAALARRLGIQEHALGECSIARRAHDARRRSNISLIYTVDAIVAQEEVVLSRHGGDRKVGRTPDTSYRYVAHAPARLPTQPLVVGAGPCGLFAALVLAMLIIRSTRADARGSVGFSAGPSATLSR